MSPVRTLMAIVKPVSWYVVMVSAIGATAVQAQEPDLNEMRRSIGIFSGVLSEGLEINTRAGIFSPFNGSVSGDYYGRQGVVLEITSPLANSRSAYSWQSFESKLQQLSGQISNLVNSPRVSPPNFEAMRESMELSLRSSTAQGAYSDFLEKVRSTNFSEEIELALAKASSSALTLHELGQIDDERLNAIMARVSEWRTQVNAQVAAMRQLSEEARAATPAPSGDDETLLQVFEQTLTNIVTAAEPLRAAASEQAAQLAASAEQAQRERDQEWEQELVVFEQKLFTLVCDYSAALRALPANEHLTLVLKGLGDVNENRREDRIHVLDKGQLQGCLQGDFGASQLQSSALTYSF